MKTYTINVCIDVDLHIEDETLEGAMAYAKYYIESGRLTEHDPKIELVCVEEPLGTRKELSP